MACVSNGVALRTSRANGMNETAVALVLRAVPAILPLIVHAIIAGLGAPMVFYFSSLTVRRRARVGFYAIIREREHASQGNHVAALVVGLNGSVPIAAGTIIPLVYERAALVESGVIAGESAPTERGVPLVIEALARSRIAIAPFRAIVGDLAPGRV